MEHRDAGRFGVEVTEFFDTESRARLERIEGYAGDLLAGKDFKHKDDRRLLKVTKVDYETKDGRGRITGVPAIMQRNPSHAELDRALAERVNEKAKSLPDEIDGIAHVNLIVIDRSFCLSRFNPEDFSEFYSDPACQLRKAVSQSPFREVFLVAEMQGTTGYVPLKMLGMVTELFRFCAAAAETESTKAIPEETEGLEVSPRTFKDASQILSSS